MGSAALLSASVAFIALHVCYAKRCGRFGCATGPPPSAAPTTTYAPMAEFTSNLPIFVINTLGSDQIPDEPKIEASLRVYSIGPDGTAALSRPATQQKIGLERRGQDSLLFPKNQFAMEFWDDRFRTESTSALGMQSAKNWVLHAPYIDESLVRNAFAYNISRSMGRWAPNTRFIELFIISDDATRTLPSWPSHEYRGVYVLMERVDNSRLGLKGPGDQCL